MGQNLCALIYDLQTAGWLVNALLLGRDRPACIHGLEAQLPSSLAEMPGSEPLYTACRHGHCVFLPACLADCCSPAPCLPGNGLTSRL